MKRQVGTKSKAKRQSRVVLPFALCLLPFALSVHAGAQNLPSAAPAQSQPSAPNPKGSQQSFILRSQTNVVLIDVRVRDKSGQPLNDLKQSDFRVWEDGVEQTLTSFSLENVEKLTQATGSNEQSQVIDLEKLPPQVNAEEVIQDHRLLVLFFDLSSMPSDDLMRAIKASTDFLKNRMTPADLVAVVTYTSSLRVAQNFTNDRDALTKVLHAIQVGEESSSLSAQGTEGAAGGTDASGNEIVTQDVSDAFTPDMTEFNIFNTDEKLAAIESLAHMLRAVPGRKSVLHFSSGISRTGQENQAQLRATIDEANRANVSLYTMDSRGLAALPPGGDASTASPSGTAIYSGSAVASQVSSLQGSRETLASLAADTGGRTFYDLNDFTPAFEQIQKENSSYYLVGYTPSNLRSDGRFRRIRVEVARTGVKVQARPGYFAPKDFRQFTRQDKEVQLEQAMDLDVPFVDLPFVVDTAYFERPDKKFSLVLAAKIPGSEVSFLKKSGKHQTEFDFAWKVTDAKNNTVVALRDTLPVKMTDETYEEIVSGNLLYEGEVTLPPGKYNLKTVVRENQGGKIGTFEAPLVVPEPSESALNLSSVVLSNEVKNPDQFSGAKLRHEKDSPLQVGSRSVLPSVTRVFRSNQTLSVYLESYLSKAAASEDGNSGSSSPPSIALVFFRGGRKFAEAGPFAAKQVKSSDHKASYFAEIPLEKFPAGRYTLQVNVLAPGLEKAAFARVPLAIVKPPARAPNPGTGR